MKKKIIMIVLCVAVFLSVGGIIVISMNSKENKDQISESEVKDDLILIQGGTYAMGSPTSEAQRENDEIQHQVQISSFYISPYEVKQADYESVMNKNPSEFKGQDLPVENISWYDAIEYCNKLSQKMNLMPAYTIDGDKISWNQSADGYRLLTEAEWEYAARATTSTPFNTETSISDQEANYYGHYPYLIEENYFSQDQLETKPGTYRQETTSVGSFQANQWQLYDMHGNVREWCWDYYGEYNLDNLDNPSGPAEGQQRITRGGGWNDYAKHLRSAYRSSQGPHQTNSNIGFRIARNVNTTNGNVVDTITVQTSAQEMSSQKTLIVYFSWGGNTEGIARQIQEKTGADIFEITLENPYSSQHNTVLDEAQRDLNNNARPKISQPLEDISKYDAILLGYPNWWATIPMPIATFLESYDFHQKLIVPFCSHGGGQFGQSINDISKLAPQSTIGEPLSIHYSGDSHLSEEISEWLKENKISEK